MKTLIVYYSRAGNNYVNGGIKRLTVGNTEIAAKMLSEMLDADMLCIEQAAAYSDDYKKCTEEAKIDLSQNARPEIRNYPDSLDGYDTVYLGYPNYWGTMPMAVFTFLEKYDWQGKTIKPFCTHEGSGMGGSETDIKRLCPDAKVSAGLAIRGGSVQNAGKELEMWTRK